ncbi:MAG: InlB B-repeat-containing protein [Clostridia bacterium]|nr:InlB B-repeat-containing protein [Clostridia bacterium]
MSKNSSDFNYTAMPKGGVGIAQASMNAGATDVAIPNAGVLGRTKTARKKSPNNWTKSIVAALLALGLAGVALYFILSAVLTPRIDIAADWTDGLTAQAVGAETWEGEGTLAMPFVLNTATDLAQLAVNVNAGTTYAGQYLTLGANVNLGGKQWTPIGTATNPFMGNFDGLDKGIFWLTIAKSNLEYTGFFGVTAGGVIENINFFNPFIRAVGDAGTVAGMMTAGTIQSCSVLDCKKVYGDYIYENGANENYIIEHRYLLDSGNKSSSQSSGTTSKLYYESEISATGNVGGVIGYINTSNSTTTYVLQCIVDTGSYESTNNNCGGIAGESRAYATNLTGSDCRAVIAACLVCFGDFTSGSGYGVGNIAGLVQAGSQGTSYKSGNSDIKSCLAYSTAFGGGSPQGAIAGESDATNSHGRTRLYDNYWWGTDGSSACGGNGSYSSQEYEVNNVELGSDEAYCTSSSLPSAYTTEGSYTNDSNTYTWSSYWYGKAPSDSGLKESYYLPYPNGMSSYAVLSGKSAYNSFTISYTLNSGTAGSSKPTSYTASASKQTKTVSNPTRSNYDFDGWTVTRSGTYGGTAPTISGTTLTIPASSYGNITLEASWTASTYTRYVYAYYNKATATSTYTQGTTGGSVGFTSSCGYSSDSDEFTSSSPTRYAKAATGYSFYGWYSSTSSSASRLSTSTSCSLSNSSLYARFNINSYTLTINPNGGSYGGSTSNSTVTQYYKTTYSLSTPTRTGYTFGSWSLYSGYGSVSGSTYTFGAGAGQVRASWTVNSYTLTINPNGGTWGGSTSNSTKTQNYATTLDLGTPTRTGYTFNGWTLSSGSGSLSGTTYTYGAGAGTVKANWTINSYTITAESGGNGTVSGGGTYNYNTSVTLTATPNEGYKFVNWTNASGTSVSTNASYTFTATADVTYTANFTIQTFVVTATAGNVGGTVTGSGTYNWGSTATITATPTSGYMIDYWVVNGTTDTSAVNIYSATIKQTTTITAYFKIARFMSSANAGGEVRVSGGDSDSTSVTYEAVAYAGYYLLGWYVDGELYKNGSTIVTDKIITLTGENALGTRVNAVFGTTNGGTPSNDYDGSTGATVCATTGGEARMNGYDSSDTTVHFSAAITQEGYEFVGWFIYGEDDPISTEWSVDLNKSDIAGKVIIAKFVNNENPSINDDTDNTGPLT